MFFWHKEAFVHRKLTGKEEARPARPGQTPSLGCGNFLCMVVAGYVGLYGEVLFKLLLPVIFLLRSYFSFI